MMFKDFITDSLVANEILNKKIIELEAENRSLKAYIKILENNDEDDFSGHWLFEKGRDEKKKE